MFLKLCIYGNQPGKLKKWAVLKERDQYLFLKAHNYVHCWSAMIK